ncbi:RTA1 like protein-domain-containing protein [Aspergillus cavernicola]|uniref:RTA1 like protein-domain-containing protein n=1 Tax=Aspergillus cavernicola TaxID=176166 RepID=A0ABR4I1W1_9EURO
MPKLEPLRSGYYVWHYSRRLHFWKLFKTKVRFTLPFAIGGLFEFIGYATRAGAYNKTGRLMPFVIQSVFVLVAPTLFAAAVYMVLARIMRSVDGQRYSPIRIQWVTKLFNIVLAGLVLQILTFVVFLTTAIIFNRRMNRQPTPAAINGDVPWKKHLYSMYTISTMILFRSVFRVIEYGLGNDGYQLSNEWPTYVLDAVPMFIAMVLFAVWYPSELQPFLLRSDSEAAEVQPKV